MPKLIEHLRENIIRCARGELLERGYGALTIRSVAKDCGIAVGTVYNYFPSKDMLTGAVLLEDWLVSLSHMKKVCREAETVEEGLTGLYNAVTSFSTLYRPVWAGYTFSDSARTAFGERHNLLVGQLADCIRPILERLQGEEPEKTAVFLAENVLICAGDSLLDFDGFLHIVQRLLP